LIGGAVNTLSLDACVDHVVGHFSPLRFFPSTWYPVMRRLAYTNDSTSIRRSSPTAVRLLIKGR